MEPTSRNSVGCLTLIAGALFGAIAGALCAFWLDSAVLSAPVVPAADPEGRLGQGIARTFEAVRAMLVGAVIGSILGTWLATVLDKKTGQDRREDGKPGL